MRVSVRGNEQLRELARDLKKTGDRELEKQLRSTIRKAMDPMKRAVQANARAIPAKGPRHTGLRRAIARAATVKVAPSGTAAVTLEISRSKMPAGKGSLPALMEGRGTWRHPVFGNRHAWATQRPHPFFWRGVEPRIKDVRQAVIEAVEAVIDKYLAS